MEDDYSQQGLGDNESNNDNNLAPRLSSLSNGD